MFDIKWIRDNPDKFDEAMKLRGLNSQAARLIELDEIRRSHIVELQKRPGRKKSGFKRNWQSESVRG